MNIVVQINEETFQLNVKSQIFWELKPFMTMCNSVTSILMMATDTYYLLTFLVNIYYF